jgi:saccharopine dehydrogenase (NAD+, L-lysine forming)
MTKIGILREGKVPPDARVPLTPDQCADVMKRYPQVQIVVEPSPIRCFADSEYAALGIPVESDLSDCDIIMGVKEVPMDWLIPHKTYFFFSHTIKQQPYNRRLLQTVLERQIRLIDYEVLTDERANRLIAFGFYAGVVGAHNGLWTFGKRTGTYALPRMCETHDYAAVKAAYAQTQLPPIRIVLTGNGRVAAGALQNLHDMGIHQVSPEDFLKQEYNEAVFTQIHAQEYARHKDGLPFDKGHFYVHGEEYVSTFLPYAHKADIFLNCIYYDGRAPMFFTVEDMLDPRFRIKTIADITCDIMPGASVPSTIRPSVITDPIYGFDPHTGAECAPFSPQSVDVMAIDNLPSELPRDASQFFGKQLIDNILPELLTRTDSKVIQRGTIAEGGQLTPFFAYLDGYVHTPKTTEPSLSV